MEELLEGVLPDGARWKRLDVLGYPNYRVTDDGRVFHFSFSQIGQENVNKIRNLFSDGWLKTQIRDKFGLHYNTVLRILKNLTSQDWRELAQRKHHTGRIHIALFHNGKKRNWLVHHLVLTAFVGPCPPNQECCHNNRIPADNRVENLRWDTHTGNMQDTIKHGTHNRGERSGKAKLTTSEVLAIRELYNQGMKIALIAKRFELSFSHVFNIVNKIVWFHI